MSENPRRTPLEPFFPAVVGVGLVHLLIGMCVWIVYPLFPQRSKPEAVAKASSQKWFSPSDFLGESKAPEVKPQPVADVPPPVAVISPPAPPSSSREVIAPPGPVIPINRGLIPPPVLLTPANAAGVGLPVTEMLTHLAVIPPPIPVISPRVPLTPPLMSPITQVGSTPVPGVQAKPVQPVEALVVKSVVPEVIGAPKSASKPNIVAAKTSEPPAQKVIPVKDVASPGGMAAADSPTLASQASISTSSPPVAPATKPMRRSYSSGGSGRKANKYITLSFINENVGTKPVLNLLDIAKINEATRVDQVVGGGSLDAVEQALQQALMREWQPPSIDAVPPAQRRAVVDLVIWRDGSVKSAYLQTPSGSEEMDSSVRMALSRVKKISETLPSSFPKERYPVRVNLLIE